MLYTAALLADPLTLRLRPSRDNRAPANAGAAHGPYVEYVTTARRIAVLHETR
jgi:hypothetical protein